MKAQPKIKGVYAAKEKISWDSGGKSIHRIVNQEECVFVDHFDFVDEKET